MMAEKKDGTVQFRSVLLLAGKSATGIQVPDDIISQLGTSKKPAVKVTINDYTYRSTIATMGGKFMLPVSAEVRGYAKVAAGDEVEVSLELDTAPREVHVPEDFLSALQGEQDAEKFFYSLSYSNQRRFVLSIQGAKTEDTRLRRIAKAVADLKTGKI
jgi:hypothetical protein